MSKTKGVFVTIKTFLPIPKDDYDKQAEAYQTLGGIKKSGKLPPGFMDKVTIVDLATKEGGYEFPTETPDAAPPEPAKK